MTSLLKLKAGVALTALVLSGCSTTEDPRLEGVALSGGNAIAHNNALQIIDPWPHGVTRTDLATQAHPGGGSGNGQTQPQPAVVVLPGSGEGVGGGL